MLLKSYCRFSSTRSHNQQVGIRSFAYPLKFHTASTIPYNPYPTTVKNAVKNEDKMIGNGAVSGNIYYLFTALNLPTGDGVYFHSYVEPLSISAG